MNSGMQCEAGLTPERVLERLAVGEDAQFANLARLIGGLEGIADRLAEAQKFLFATGRWEGASADLANKNFGIMQGNITRLAEALNKRYEMIAGHNDERRSKAAELLKSLPTAGVPSYVQDALNRNDVSVQTPFGTISLNEGAENIADFFGAQRSVKAAEKLEQLRIIITGQSKKVQRPLGFHVEPVKLADGSSAGVPGPAPDPGSYTTTLPPHPDTNWRRPPGGGWDWPDGPNDDGPEEHNDDDPKDPNDPDGPKDPKDRDPKDPENPNNNDDPKDPKNPSNDPLNPDDGVRDRGPGLGVGLAGGGLAAAGMAVGARFAGLGGLGAGFGNAAGLRGGAGLASGQGGASASAAGSGASGARSGGMLGAGGAGSDEKKKRNEPGLGYIAPKFEDEGENGPAADASRAGRRRDG